MKRIITWLTIIFTAIFNNLSYLVTDSSMFDGDPGYAVVSAKDYDAKEQYQKYIDSAKPGGCLSEPDKIEDMLVVSIESAEHKCWVHKVVQSGDYNNDIAGLVNKWTLGEVILCPESGTINSNGFLTGDYDTSGKDMEVVFSTGAKMRITNVQKWYCCRDRSDGETDEADKHIKFKHTQSKHMGDIEAKKGSIVAYATEKTEVHFYKSDGTTQIAAEDYFGKFANLP